MTNAINLSEFTIDDRGASELSRLVEVKALIKTFTEEKEAIEQRLKIELQSNPDPIFDGEHGLVATLKEKNKPATFDLINMADKHPSYIAELAKAGCLNVAVVQARGLKGKSAAADTLFSKYEMPGGVTYELRVEKP
jgi:hypothetical protein